MKSAHDFELTRSKEQQVANLEVESSDQKFLLSDASDGEDKLKKQISGNT